MTREAGFTLMETLVAFTVFSLASVALLDIYARANESRAAAAANSVLAARAQALIAEAEMAAAFNPLSQGTDPDGTRWRVNLVPVNDRLVRLEVELAAPGGREARFRTLRTRTELGLELPR